MIGNGRVRLAAHGGYRGRKWPYRTARYRKIPNFILFPWLLNINSVMYQKPIIFEMDPVSSIVFTNKINLRNCLISSTRLITLIVYKSKRALVFYLKLDFSF